MCEHGDGLGDRMGDSGRHTGGEARVVSRGTGWEHQKSGSKGLKWVAVRG